MWAVVPYLHIKAFVYYEHYCSCYQRPVKIKGLVGRHHRDKQRDMPRTHTICVDDFSPPDNAEIHTRILEGGRQLALRIGKDFPVAGEVWPELNKFHRMIDGKKLNDTWVTLITPEDREVSVLRWPFACLFLLSLILYFLDCIAGGY